MRQICQRTKTLINGGHYHFLIFTVRKLNFLLSRNFWPSNAWIHKEMSVYLEMGKQNHSKISHLTKLEIPPCPFLNCSHFPVLPERKKRWNNSHSYSKRCTKFTPIQTRLMENKRWERESNKCSIWLPRETKVFPSKMKVTWNWHEHFPWRRISHYHRLDNTNTFLNPHDVAFDYYCLFIYL